MAAIDDDRRQRPSVHALVAGVFLQAPLSIKESGALVVPLDPPESAFAEYLGSYLRTLGEHPDEATRDAVAESSKARGAAVSIILPLDSWPGIDAVDAAIERRLLVATHVLAWVTGNDGYQFGTVILGPNEGESWSRLSPKSGDKRYRLGFGNTGPEFAAQVARIADAAEHDEHFAFALSIFHDAHRETNVRFRLARLFCCLESLAYRLKNKDIGSRDAVRGLLGLAKDSHVQIAMGGRTYAYDPILASGKLRDHLYHGIPYRADTVQAREKDTVELLRDHPEEILSSMTTYCEMELARWANGASKGQLPQSAAVPPAGRDPA